MTMGGEGTGGLVQKHETKYLFKWLILMQIAVYMEAGVVPVLLHELTDAFGLSFGEKGMLGGVTWLLGGLVLPFAPLLFSKYSPKSVLLTTLVMNLVFIICFAWVPEGHSMRSLLLTARAGVGATQAFLAVYVPVWIDVFAPEHLLSRWYALYQVALRVAMFLGYVEEPI